MNTLARATVVALYFLSIVVAVWAVDNIGTSPAPGAPKVVPVGFGLTAPAAVYVVGVTLLLRDLVHEAIKRRGTFIVIVLAAVLSALFNPGLALASGLAFLVSETIDMLIYEQVRDRWGQPTGMLVSNAVSIPIDSLIFLGIAFGSLQFFWGQVVGKSIATVLALTVPLVIGTFYHSRRENKLAAAEAERQASLTPQQRRLEDVYGYPVRTKPKA